MFLLVCSGQRWVGQGSAYSPQPYGWSRGWEAVAIKTIPFDDLACQERAALQKVVRHAGSGPRHVTQLVEDFEYFDEALKQRYMCLVTKYVTWQSHLCLE